MNQNDHQDDFYIEQLDRLLEKGHPHSDPLVNTLAHILPQADQAFQQELEVALMAHLQPQPIVNWERQMPKVNQSIYRALRPPLTWTVTLAVVALAVAGIMLANLNRAWLPLTAQTPPTATQIDQPVTVVVATQAIPAGTVITEAMVSVISIPQPDGEKLGLMQSGHNVFSNVESVIGQRASVAIRWFQPLETNLIFDPLSDCTAPCVDVPQDYQSVGFPLQTDTLQGLTIGDRVDVLAVIDGEIREIVANVVLTKAESGIVTFAAPAWQASVLAWLYRSGAPYALRLHTGPAPAPLDNAPADVVIVISDAELLDFLFDVIVNVPADKGFMLIHLPGAIDDVPFSSNGDTLYFRFKRPELVNVTDGSTVTLRLPGADAANLDYLLRLRGATASFVPAEPAR
ncbi:MAG: SAF domain-containing protein [Anaerolineae bacterium]